MKNDFLLGVLLAFSVGCSFMPGMRHAITVYHEDEGKVSLGDSKEKVLATFGPAQEEVPGVSRKSPDKFMDGKTLVEIFYMRSGWSSDGLTTDDEFTPYIFRDGVLTGIGWAVLGGPKTTAQSQQEIKVKVEN